MVFVFLPLDGGHPLKRLLTRSRGARAVSGLHLSHRDVYQGIGRQERRRRNRRARPQGSCHVTDFRLNTGDERQGVTLHPQVVIVDRRSNPKRRLLENSDGALAISRLYLAPRDLDERKGFLLLLPNGGDHAKGACDIARLRHVPRDVQPSTGG